MIGTFFRKALAKWLARPARHRGGPPTRRLKACLFKLDGIGDFVLAAGAIRRLFDHYGRENCVLVTSTPAAQLARAEFPGAEIFGFDQYIGGIKSWLALRPALTSKLAGYEFDELISLRYQRTTLHHLALSWIRASHSAGLLNKADFLEADRAIYQFPLSDSFVLPMHAPAGFCLELERHRQLLGHILRAEIPMEDLLPRLSFLKPERGDELVVTPYSSAGIKDYPDEHLGTAILEMRRQVNAQIRLSGGPADHARLEHLAAVLRGRCVPGVIVDTPDSVVQFARLVGRAGAVLTVDTSTAHLATAMDKPAVILIGGGQYGEFGPWRRSGRQKWLNHELPCYGCEWRCQWPEVRCLTEIPPTTVAGALLEIWQKDPLA